MDELQELRRALELLQKKYNVDLGLEVGTLVPATIFSTDLSPLASLVTYLDKQGMSVQSIAETLQRSEKTIYQARSKAKLVVEEDCFVPLSIFSTRKLSIMECLVSYLHQDKSMRFIEIAQLTNKDPRTIWTMWHRAQKKNAQQ